MLPSFTQIFQEYYRGIWCRPKFQVTHRAFYVRYFDIVVLLLFTKRRQQLICKIMQYVVLLPRFPRSVVFGIIFSIICKITPSWAVLKIHMVCCIAQVWSYRANINSKTLQKSCPSSVKMQKKCKVSAYLDNPQILEHVIHLMSLLLPNDLIFEKKFNFWYIISNDWTGNHSRAKCLS